VGAIKGGLPRTPKRTKAKKGLLKKRKGGGKKVVGGTRFTRGWGEVPRVFTRRSSNTNGKFRAARMCCARRKNWAVCHKTLGGGMDLIFVICSVGGNAKKNTPNHQGGKGVKHRKAAWAIPADDGPTLTQGEIQEGGTLIPKKGDPIRGGQLSKPKRKNGGIRGHCPGTVKS